MKQKKLLLIVFVILASILFLGEFNTLNAQIYCKLNFCNCCGDSIFYHIYDLSGREQGGGFWTTGDGCTHGNPGIANLQPGSTYYILADCSDGKVTYFTACVCGEEQGYIDTIRIHCCDDADDKPRSNNIQEYNTLPKEFSLFQNYPNPFNPFTNIKFALPSEAFVKLIIYDVTGREIEILVNGFTKSGYHEVNWDAKNVASGIYFYRIEAGTFTDEKKMVLIK